MSAESLTAIIGGTALSQLPGMRVEARRVVRTPFGEPAGALLFGRIDGAPIVFLARHGYGHTLPPHKVNYRANLFALRDVGAARVFAVSSVAALIPALLETRFSIPDQVIDYTWGRAHTFEEGVDGPIRQIDFDEPFDAALRAVLQRAVTGVGSTAHFGGTYGCVNGPRHATAAEVRKLIRDGNHMVGSTLMPEAALARELDLPYAALCVVTHMAAGSHAGPVASADLISGSRAEAVPVAQVVLAEACKLAQGQ
jgi:5'-methylthioinosine phosphorylase